MSTKLSDRVQRVKPSATLAVSAQAIELKKAGRDIISLSSGEPDFDTPTFIKQAAIDAINAGKTRYTPVGGIVELKDAIVEKYKNDNKLTYTTNEVMAGTGGKQLIYNLFQAILEKQNEVLIPTPYWVSYPDMALLANATPVFLSTGISQNFKITPEQLKSSITERTRMLVLNSPSNPAGAMYDRNELQALGELLLQYENVIIASDDIYEKITFGGQKYVSILNVVPELKARTVLLNGVSKAYSMTGWRLGFAAGPEYIIKAMSKIQSQSTSNPSSVSQYAALAALAGDQSLIKKMNHKFATRNQFVVKALNEIDGVECIESQGAFYAFANFRKVIERTTGVGNDVELCAHLLDKAEVAVVPGSAFGNPGYIRFSCATSMANLKEAIARIAKILERG